MVAYNSRVLPLIKWMEAAYPDITQPWYSDDSFALYMFDNINFNFNSFKCNSLSRGIILRSLKELWLCIRTISKRGSCLSCVMGLMFAWAHVILAVILGMINPNAVVSNIGQKNWIEIFMQSPKRRINLIRKVTPQWSMRSNWGAFFSTRDKRYGTSVYEGGGFCGKHFHCIFFGKSKTLPPIVGTPTFPVKKAGLGLQN